MKKKLLYYAAVFCSGLAQCYYMLLLGAPRPLSCTVSLFKRNIFITIVLPQRTHMLALSLPQREVPY